VTDPSKQLLCPLIFYTDDTLIDSVGHFRIEPFVFTPTILSSSA
jgi:hypothetical protein